MERVTPNLVYRENQNSHTRKELQEAGEAKKEMESNCVLEPVF